MVFCIQGKIEQLSQSFPRYYFAKCFAAIVGMLKIYIFIAYYHYNIVHENKRRSCYSSFICRLFLLTSPYFSETGSGITQFSLRVSNYTRLKLFSLLIQALNQYRHCHTNHHRLYKKEKYYKSMNCS